MADDAKGRRLILVNGQHYVEGISKKSNSPRNKLPPRTYEEARQILLDGIKKTRDQFQSLDSSKKISEIVVFCLRINPNFLAKSYFPRVFIEKTGVTILGSRKWRIDHTGLNYSKLVFVWANAYILNNIESLLNSKASSLPKLWYTDACIIDEISLLRRDEQLLGFDKNWKEGIIELVLHPLAHYSQKAVELLKKQLRVAEVPENAVHIRQYSSGLTFIGLRGNPRVLESLENFNPLRTAHPLPGWLPELRAANSIDAPRPQPAPSISSVKVGVFDGGAKDTVPLLAGHATNIDLARSPAVSRYLKHGTAVTGAVLYGPLNDYGPTATVPPPKVSVESFRVFPPSKRLDIELYQAMDLIENTVPQYPNIKVFNISFGPKRPIIDDDIGRFTFMLDSIAYSRKVLFTVAVGNDGHLASPLNRIQPPSDTVNGLGVASWTRHFTGGTTTQKRAPYSSKGPGREGSKIKPDIAGFGGCNNHPIHLVSDTSSKLISSQGTSFASPIVAGIAAELLGRCDNISTLMAKVLLLHTAVHPKESPDYELGYGCVAENVDQIIHCSSHSVTTLFQGSLRQKGHAKLPILLPTIATNGAVYIKVTIGVLSQPDIQNPDEYTNVAIEDTFYPNSKVFRYSENREVALLGKRRAKTKNLDLRHPREKEEAEQLIKDGWKKSSLPVSASSPKRETELRQELKWDSIVQKRFRKRIASLHEPFIVLHGLGRNPYLEYTSDVDYAVAVTLEIPTYKGDLYQEVVRKYTALQPIRVKAINELYIRLT